MIGSESWLGVPSDRVVAIEATLGTGKFQVGSGYLLTRGTVVTARHCTEDRRTGRPAASISAARRSDGASAPARLAASTLDVAVLAVADSDSWAPGGPLGLPRFGRVDASHSGELLGCEAVGFPLWQLDPQRRHRHAAELHGSIRATDGAESGLLVMRDPLLWDVSVPDGVARDDHLPGSPWGGLSGALVFCAGTALGIVVEHHPRQGHAALTILPIQRIAEAAAAGGPGAAQVASALGLPRSGDLPAVVPARHAGPATEPLAIGMEIVSPLPNAADRLSWVIVNALRAAGISPDRCERQDDGNGRQILTLPPGLNMAGTVMAILRAVRLVASQANSATSPAERATVLTTLAKGPVKLAGDSYEGPGISAASGMLKSGALGAEVCGNESADFAAMFSNDLYLQLYSQGYGLIDTSQFRAVDLVPPVSRCWVYTPAAAADANLNIAISDVPAASARSRLLSTIPLAGLGTVVLWQHSEHSRDNHGPGVDSEKDYRDPHVQHGRSDHGGRHADGPGQPGHHDYAQPEADHAYVDPGENASHGS